MGKDSSKEPSYSSDHNSKKITNKHSNSYSQSSQESNYSSDNSKLKRKKQSTKRIKTIKKKKYSSSDDWESLESDYSSENSKLKRKRSSKRKRDSESEYSSDSEEERRIRKRKERKKREEREKEKEKEKKRRKREKEKKKKKKEKKNKGAVTSSWGKYGIIRETDMWNKRPEFTAWLSEVKKVNLESLPTWEEKQMFKDFMEDHNTATFPSKKYYNLDAYFKHKLEKETKKGMKNAVQTEMTVFNDEEIRRQEMQQVRERQKAEEVEALKRSMQSGMAQAMKEQAQLREEMQFQYKLGNLEAAAAIQRRLDPDVAM